MTWKIEQLQDDHRSYAVHIEPHFVGWMRRGTGEKIRVAFGPSDYNGLLSINKVVDGHLTRDSLYVLSAGQMVELKEKGTLTILGWDSETDAPAPRRNRVFELEAA